MNREQYREALRDALEVWSLEHREAQLSPDALDVLAAKYTEDLTAEGVRPKELFSACKVASRRWAHFPKMADILKAVDEYRQCPRTEQVRTLQLTDTTSHHDLTSEEIARNKERVGHIVAMLSGRMSLEDAVIAVEGTAHIAEFGA